jgi:RimJ/RimL family protein N-acetyltransferase
MIDGTKVRIRQKQLSDARNDYNWASDPELSDLDAVPPLDIPFDIYREEFREQMRNPSPTRKNFSIETMEEGRHIGNCVYYNIDKIRRQAEVGIMIGDRTYWDKGYGTDAMSTLVDYIYTNMDFKRLYLKTLEKNLRAQHSFLKCGFAPYGHMERDGYNFLLMELPRIRWEQTHGKQNKKRKFFQLKIR